MTKNSHEFNDHGCSLVTTTKDLNQIRFNLNQIRFNLNKIRFNLNQTKQPESTPWFALPILKNKPWGGAQSVALRACATCATGGAVPPPAGRDGHCTEKVGWDLEGDVPFQSPSNIFATNLANPPSRPLPVSSYVVENSSRPSSARSRLRPPSRKMFLPFQLFFRSLLPLQLPSSNFPLPLPAPAPA